MSAPEPVTWPKKKDSFDAMVESEPAHDVLAIPFAKRPPPHLGNKSRMKCTAWAGIPELFKIPSGTHPGERQHSLDNSQTFAFHDAVNRETSIRACGVYRDVPECCSLHLLSNPGCIVVSQWVRTRSQTHNGRFQR